MEQLIQGLVFYSQIFPLEKKCAQEISSFLKKNDKKSFHNWHWDDGHITASMLITNPTKTKVLLMFHKKLQRWLQFGGHSDDNPDTLSTAIREFHEESGISESPEIFSYFPDGLPPVFDVDIHYIPADLKGRPAHKHYDIRFLGIVPDDIKFQREESEVDDIRWFHIEGIEEYLEEEYLEEEGLIRMMKKIVSLQN